MAQRNNARVGYNKEAMSSFYELLRCLNAEVDEVINSSRPSIAYLTSEENVSGGDSEDFVKNVTAYRTGLLTTKSKVEQLQKVVGGTVEKIGIVAGKNTKTLDEAKQDMGKAIMALREAGKK